MDEWLYNGCQCQQGCLNAFNDGNAGLTLVQHCFSTIHYPSLLPRVAFHRLGTTTLIQLWYNVGTTIPDLETQKFENKEFFWEHGNFRNTECFNAVNATLVYGCFNICTTIPDLGTTHPLPWVGWRHCW